MTDADDRRPAAARREVARSVQRHVGQPKLDGKGVRQRHVQIDRCSLRAEADRVYGETIRMTSVDVDPAPADETVADLRGDEPRTSSKLKLCAVARARWPAVANTPNTFAEVVQPFTVREQHERTARELAPSRCVEPAL